MGEPRSLESLMPPGWRIVRLSEQQWQGLQELGEQDSPASSSTLANLAARLGLEESLLQGLYPGLKLLPCRPKPRWKPYPHQKPCPGQEKSLRLSVSWSRMEEDHENHRPPPFARSTSSLPKDKKSPLPKDEKSPLSKDEKLYLDNLSAYIAELRAKGCLDATYRTLLPEEEPGYSSQGQACKYAGSSSPQGISEAATQPGGPGRSDLSGDEASQALEAFKRLSVSALTPANPEEGDLKDLDKSGPGDS